MKNSNFIKILSFRNKHQIHVDELLMNISLEFDKPILSASSLKMKNVAHVIGNKFWVAFCGKSLIGTIGIICLKNNIAALKSMFVIKEYRGGDVADLLFQKLLRYAKRKSISIIYLGTMEQMKGAQKFYEKNEFDRVGENDLPNDFPKNPLDVVFYRMTLNKNMKSLCSPG